MPAELDVPFLADQAPKIATTGERPLVHIAGHVFTMPCSSLEAAILNLFAHT